MPQWQGGNNPIYYLGAQLLYWLAPKGDADFAEVPVAAPDGSQLPLEGGVLGKSAILKQNEAALDIIRQSAPDRIVTFGGDCSVSLAPFSYLASRKATGASKLLVHFDLDVLNPVKFREQLFNNPAGLADQFKNSPTGTMDFETVVNLLNNSADVVEIVGLTIAEHLPWDADNLRKALARLPILAA